MVLLGKMTQLLVNSVLISINSPHLRLYVYSSHTVSLLRMCEGKL